MKFFGKRPEDSTAKNNFGYCFEQKINSMALEERWTVLQAQKILKF